MALVKNLLPLPLIGGINESEDPLLSQHAQQMINCRYDKAPAISKRPGYDCIGPYNTDIAGNTLPTGELLCTYNGTELLRFGGGKLHSFVGAAVLGSSSDWVYRDRVPECIIEKTGVATTSGTGAYAPQVCVVNGYAIYVYVASDVAGHYVYCDVVQLSTGSRIYSQKQLASSVSSNLNNPKVVGAGTNACIAWGDPGGSAIVATWLDLTTMQFLNNETAATAVTGLVFDIDIVGATEVALVAERSSGSNRIFVYSFSNIPITGTWTIVHTGASIVSSETGVAAMQIRYASGERIWVAFTSSLTTNGAYVATLTTAFALATAPFGAFTGVSLGTPTILTMERLSSTSCIIAVSMGTGIETYWNECTSAGVLSYNPPRVALNTYLLSRPLVRNGRAYMLVANYHSTHATQFLLDLSAAEALPVNGSPRIVAVVLPRQLPSFVSNLPRAINGANWSFVSSNEYLVTSQVSGDDPGTFAIVTLKARFDSDWTRTTAQLGSNLLAIGGGALSLFDGSSVTECGFAYEPDVASVVITQGTGGSLTALGVYGWAIVYSFRDAQGNIHRSEPCFTASTTLTTSNNKATLAIPPLQITNKGANGLNAKVLVEVYRTQTTKSVYLYVGSTVNAIGSTSVSFVDTFSDTAIGSNAAVYTDGGVLSHQIPAGGPDVMSYLGCMILHASDDDSLWISGEILQGEGPWFNSQENIASFENGRITALGLMGETPIIFKEDSTYYLQGSPPSDTGASTITAPIKVQTEVGCTSASSVVMSHYGIARMTASGLYMLNSSLQDQPIGWNVEGSYRTGMAAAVVLPDQGEIRWLQTGTGGFDVLTWDYWHSDQLGSPIWYKDTLSDVRGATTANPLAGTVWQGKFVWLSNAGYLYQENQANFCDNDGLTTNAYVQSTFETSYAKPFTVGGYARVWRVLLTGYRSSPFGLTITITTDDGSQTMTWTDTEIQAFSGLPDIKLMAHVADQKCRWMKVMVQDSDPSSGSPGTRAGMILRDVTLEIGQKPSGARFPANNRK